MSPVKYVTDSLDNKVETKRFLFFTSSFLYGSLCATEVVKPPQKHTILHRFYIIMSLPAYNHSLRGQVNNIKTVHVYSMVFNYWI